MAVFGPLLSMLKTYNLNQVEQDPQRLATGQGSGATSALDTERNSRYPLQNQGMAATSGFTHKKRRSKFHIIKGFSASLVSLQLSRN